jgi:hypothetical protein
LLLVAHHWPPQDLSRYRILLHAAIIALEEICCCLAGTPIGGLQFTGGQFRPAEFLECTSLAVDEFQHLSRP